MTYDLNAAVAGAESGLQYMKQNNIGGQIANALIVDTALSRGILVESGPNRRVQLTKANTMGWFHSGRTNLNTQLAAKSTRYKQVTSALLRAHSIFAPRNAAFESTDIEQAWNWAKYLLPVVLKPTDAKNGSLVFVSIDDKTDFNSAFTAIASRHKTILVEQFVKGIEHRVLTVNYRIVGAIRRVPAHVVGDGSSTVDELIQAKTARRLATRNPVHLHIKIDDMVLRELDRNGMRLTSVPANNETVYLRSTSNIHTGGDAIDVTDDLSESEIAFVESAARAFPGLRVAGFDVLLPRNGQGTDPCVIEANYNPAISMHHFPSQGTPRNVAGSILDAMFPSSVQ